MRVYNIYKKIGQTPLQALEKFRLKKGIPKSVPLTYAGRLDPMAEGVLIILAGTTQSQKEKYLELPKVYEAEILFGFSTDTFDVLGLANKSNHRDFDIEQIKKILKCYVGKINLPLPVYSSPPVNGKPLFAWAREGKIVEIPKRNMEIRKLEIKGFKKYSAVNLLKSFRSRITKVDGDFRQAEITRKWNKVFGNNKNRYLSVKITVACASGTYIRSLADDAGKRLNSSSLLLNLKRSSVGKYKSLKSIKI